MRKHDPYRRTILSCYTGSATQAIISNFAPLLFLTFQQEFGFSLEAIGLLVSVNFGTQLAVDAFSVRYADRIGYRKMIVAAQVFSALGFVLLSILPYVLKNAYLGVVFATITYAIGGGLNEVLISPIVEACPSKHKAAAMSLLHSFYCWGSVLVVLVSTALFGIFGMSSWRIIACMWAVIPAVNAVQFARVPIEPLVAEGESLKLTELLKTGVFWLFMLLMLCAGATELSMAQWASAFAESGLKISKSMGDLAGPCFFALLMGIGRVVQYKLSDKIDLRKYLFICAVLCVASYLIVSLVPSVLIALLGFGLCGFAVAAMWPGTLSLAQSKCPRGGTAMFALLALCGDVGCSLGPALVGFVSGAMGDSLHMGLMCAAVFPLVMMVGLKIKGHKKTDA